MITKGYTQKEGGNSKKGKRMEKKLQSIADGLCHLLLFFGILGVITPLIHIVHYSFRHKVLVISILGVLCFLSGVLALFFVMNIYKKKAEQDAERINQLLREERPDV